MNIRVTDLLLNRETNIDSHALVDMIRTGSVDAIDLVYPKTTVKITKVSPEHWYVTVPDNRYKDTPFTVLTVIGLVKVFVENQSDDCRIDVYVNADLAVS